MSELRRAVRLLETCTEGRVETRLTVDEGAALLRQLELSKAERDQLRDELAATRAARDAFRDDLDDSRQDRAELTRDLRQARAERDRLAGQVHRVRDLHPVIEAPRHGCCAPPTSEHHRPHPAECAGKDHGLYRPPWPCATLRTLDGPAS